MNKLLHRAILLLPLTMLMVGCSGGDNIRQTLGLTREAPDEFKVVSRPPLSLPPDYELRPPRIGEDETGITPADQQARAAATGVGAAAVVTGTAAASTSVKAVSSYDIGSGAESNFLDKIGATQADPEIRQRLYDDYQAIRKEKEEGLFGSIIPDFSGDEELVDAAAESDRIREKQQSGEKITGEDTKTRKRKARSVIDQLF